jgi:hypothetical protein
MAELVHAHADISTRVSARREPFLAKALNQPAASIDFLRVGERGFYL